MSILATLTHKKVLLTLLTLKVGGTLCLAAYLLARKLREQSRRC